jgi:hypothetical protein
MYDSQNRFEEVLAEVRVARSIGWYSILTPACFASAPTVIEPIAAFIFPGYTLDLSPESRAIMQIFYPRGPAVPVKSQRSGG